MPVTTTVPETRNLRLRVAGMDCGSCAATIERALQGLSGLESVRVDFTTETLEATGAVTREQVDARLRELGYRVVEPVRLPPAALDARRGLRGFLRFLRSQRRTRIAAVMAFGIAVAGAWAALRESGTPVLSGVLLVAVVIGGAPIVTRGVRALLVARRVTIDLLMGIAAIGAVAIGEFGEAAAVVLLFTLGEALEAYSAERSRDALRSLMALQPDEATVLESHTGPHGTHEHDHEPAHEHYHQIRRPASEVRPGARILVRPGERIPLDGRIVAGASSINQSAVTGESMPVDRAAGDDVLAGTVNGPGALTVEVLRPAGDSTVARIAALVERALAQRTPAERFIDRFSQWYTPGVIALAVLVVAVPVLAFGQPLLSTADGANGWLYRGLAMLIIACPCALVISVPVTVVSALTRLAQLGVLVKGGGQLDRLADVSVIAFDKTGTLTTGKPRVTAIRSRECDHVATPAGDCDRCDSVIAVAAAIESSSEHPLAQAVVASANHRGLAHRLPQAVNVMAVAGKGVAGDLQGERVAIGHHDLFAHGPDCADQVCNSASAARADGQTVMLVGRGRDMLGFIGVEDQPRPESGAALAELHRIDSRLRTVMLTGDHRQVAEAVARQIGGLDEIRSDLLPADKQSVIRDLKSTGATVAMVGDGINDAPALAQADIGVAMGGAGTAQAMETADVVLVSDNLNAVPTMLRISRHTRAVVKQNIIFSLGLKLGFLALAIPGLASLWLAVLADVGATLLVTLNGMRLLRAR